MLLNHTTNHLTIRPHKTSCFTKEPWAKEKNFEDKYCHMWKEKKNSQQTLIARTKHHFQMLFAVGIKDFVLWPMSVISIFFSLGDRITDSIGDNAGPGHTCDVLPSCSLSASFPSPHSVSHVSVHKINSPWIHVDCRLCTSSEEKH